MWSATSVYIPAKSNVKAGTILSGSIYAPDRPLLSLGIPRSKRVRSGLSVGFWAFRPRRAKLALLPELWSRQILAAVVNLVE